MQYHRQRGTNGQALPTTSMETSRVTNPHHVGPWDTVHHKVPESTVSTAKNTNPYVHRQPPGNRQTDGTLKRYNGTIPTILRILPTRRLSTMATNGRVFREQPGSLGHKRDLLLRELWLPPSLRHPPCTYG